MTRAKLNPVNTAVPNYPQCSCDGTCSDCAHEMASELGSVLAVINTAQSGHDPHQLTFGPIGIAALLADALWDDTDTEGTTEA